MTNKEFKKHVLSTLQEEIESAKKEKKKFKEIIHEATNNEHFDKINSMTSGFELFHFQIKVLKGLKGNFETKLKILQDEEETGE